MTPSVPIMIKFVWVCPNCGYVKLFTQRPASSSWVCPGSCGLNYDRLSVQSLAVGVSLA